MRELPVLVTAWALSWSVGVHSAPTAAVADVMPVPLAASAPEDPQGGNGSQRSTAGMPSATTSTASGPHSRIRFDVTLLVRIGLGTLLAFAIGWEREFRRGSEVGDRTFALVSLGAAAFTAVGVENFPGTAEKVMAGVVTGVGFLGGGMILREGGVVRGLTTAAAIWATAAIGMLAGVGELLVAALVTALIILILELESIPGIRLLDARRWRRKDFQGTENERKRDE